MGRRCKEEKLYYRWDKTEKDFKCWYPRRCDGAFLFNIFNSKRQYIPIGNYSKRAGDAITFEDSFVEELEKRGYDLTTIKFEISMKEEKCND